jgi:hypothetical protein
MFHYVDLKIIKKMFRQELERKNYRAASLIEITPNENEAELQDKKTKTKKPLIYLLSCLHFDIECDANHLLCTKLFDMIQSIGGITCKTLTEPIFPLDDHTDNALASFALSPGPIFDRLWNFTFIPKSDWTQIPILDTLASETEWNVGDVRFTKTDCDEFDRRGALLVPYAREAEICDHFLLEQLVINRRIETLKVILPRWFNIFQPNMTDTRLREDDYNGPPPEGLVPLETMVMLSEEYRAKWHYHHQHFGFYLSRALHNILPFDLLLLIGSYSLYQYKI